MNPLTRQFLADPIGSYPSATVACLDATHGDLPRRMLDAQRNRLYLERLSAAGVPAALIAASTGHGHARMVEELEEWFAASKEANIGRMVLMALLRPEDGQAANEQLLDQLRELGYPVVFFRPGTKLPRAASDEQIAESLRPLVKAAAEREFAIGLYTIPDVSGVRLTADAAAALLKSPGGENIIAAKITEANYDESTLTYLQHPELARLKIVQGWDPFITRALQDGPKYDAQGRQRCGVTSGPMSFAVFQYVHLLDAAERGDWAEAEAALAAVTALFQSMQDDPGKFADLQRAKAIMGLGQPLKGEVSPAQIDRVLQALQSLPRPADRARLARSLDLMEVGPYHEQLKQLV
jgi:dihydrodipicolinate synthase/N-acetylneuraminate lyase